MVKNSARSQKKAAPRKTRSAKKTTNDPEAVRENLQKIADELEARAKFALVSARKFLQAIIGSIVCGIVFYIFGPALIADFDTDTLVSARLDGQLSIFTAQKKRQAAQFTEALEDKSHWRQWQIENKSFASHLGGAVTALGISGDGQLVVSGGEDGAIRLWKQVSGVWALFGDLKAQHKGPVTSIAVSKNGHELVSGGADGVVRLWSSQDGSSWSSDEARVSDDQGTIRSVAIAGDGLTAAAIDSFGNGKSWSRNTKNSEYTSSALSVPRARAVAISGDGKIVAVSNNRGQVVVISRDKNDAEVLSARENDSITSLSIAEDGLSIVFSTDAEYAELWTRGSQEENFRIARRLTASYWITSLAISGNGKKIAAGVSDKTAYAWAESSNWQRQELKGHQASTKATSQRTVGTVVAVSNSGELIASGGADGTVRLWSLGDSKWAQIGKPLIGHKGSVDAVAVSANGNRIVSGGKDHVVQITEFVEGKLVTIKLTGHQGAINSVAISADGSAVLSGSSDGTIRLWSNSSGTWTSVPLKGHKGSVLAVAVSADGSVIVSGGSDGHVKIWSGIGKEIPLATTDYAGQVQAVAVSEDGKFAVSGTLGGSLWFWGVVDGEWRKLDQTLTGQAGTIRSIGMSADGKTIVSADSRNAVWLWNADEGKWEGGLLTELRKPANSVAVTPDGSLVVIGEADGKVQLWSASTRIVGPKLRIPDQQVVSLAFPASQEFLVLGSSSGLRRILSTLPTGEKMGEWLDLGKENKITATHIRVAIRYFDGSTAGTYQHQLAERLRLLLAEIEESDGQIKKIESEKKRLDDNDSGNQGAIEDKPFLSLQVTRIGTIILILFMVQIFSGMYRYNTRLAAHHQARADSLRLILSQGVLTEDFSLLSSSLTPESIDFAKAVQHPGQQLLEVLKNLRRS